MSDENLEHKDHEIKWEQRDFQIGKFLYGYCKDCEVLLGSLNINFILSHMELGD